jgi:hypothetical protein
MIRAESPATLACFSTARGIEQSPGPGVFLGMRFLYPTATRRGLAWRGKAGIGWTRVGLVGRPGTARVVAAGKGHRLLPRFAFQGKMRILVNFMHRERVERSLPR